MESIETYMFLVHIGNPSTDNTVFVQFTLDITENERDKLAAVLRAGGATLEILTPHWFPAETDAERAAAQEVQE